MDENVSIDIREDVAQVHRNTQLPVNFIMVGEIENDDVKVYIKQDVFKKIEKFASSDTTKELGSILFGEYCEELNKTHVVISEFVEAKYTDASASTLTFTHETWDYVHSEHDDHYAQLKMLGWQHTHPSYGIFLSNYDMFIQENFFNLPFQIAYVVDPVQHIRGFFQWKNGKVEKLHGFYIYDEAGKRVAPLLNSVGNPPDRPVVPKRTILYIGGVFLVILGISLALLTTAFTKRLKEQEQLLASLEPANSMDTEQNDSLLNHQKAIQNTEESTDNEMITEPVQSILLSSVLATGDIDTVSALIERIETKELIVHNEDDALAKLRTRFDILKKRKAMVPQPLAQGTYVMFCSQIGYIGFRNATLTTADTPRGWFIEPNQDMTFSLYSSANDAYFWTANGNELRSGAEIFLSRKKYNNPITWQLLANEEGASCLVPADAPDLVLTYRDGAFCLVEFNEVFANSATDSVLIVSFQPA